MKLFLFLLVAVIAIAVFWVSDFSPENQKSQISSDSFIFGEFIATSKPYDTPHLGVYTKIGSHDLLLCVDPPIKILGLDSHYIFAEKSFSKAGDRDLTRDQLKPHVGEDANVVYLTIPLNDGKSIRWFSDPQFKSEITDLVGRRGASRGPPQKTSDPRRWHN